MRHLVDARISAFLSSLTYDSATLYVRPTLEEETDRRSFQPGSHVSPSFAAGRASRDLSSLGLSYICKRDLRTSDFRIKSRWTEQYVISWWWRHVLPTWAAFFLLGWCLSRDRQVFLHCGRGRMRTQIWFIPWTTVDLYTVVHVYTDLVWNMQGETRDSFLLSHAPLKGFLTMNNAFFEKVSSYHTFSAVPHAQCPAF